MRKTIFTTILLTFTILFSMCSKTMNIQSVEGFPSAESGYEKGVSAAFSGVIDGTIYLAGGCNFPEDPMAAGAQKKYYKAIYAAPIQDNKQLTWKKIGELPVEAAYGVSITYQNKLILIGGNNDDQSFANVICIQPSGDTVSIDTLPSLPGALDNMAGCLVSNHIYILGGNCNGVASNSVWALDMNAADKGWQEMPAMPGTARVQPIAAAIDNEHLGVWGGFAPKSDNQPATLATEGLSYDINTKQWTPLPAPTDNSGEIIFTGGSAAVNIPDTGIIVVGGVNKDIFLSALNNLPEGYLTHEPEWYQFNSQVLLYQQGKWKSLVQDKEIARAGCNLAYWKDAVYVMGGEMKPRIRTPRIYRIDITK